MFVSAQNWFIPNKQKSRSEILSELTNKYPIYWNGKKLRKEYLTYSLFNTVNICNVSVR